MCLKIDTILLQYTLYQFQYFITTCLCMVEIYQQTLQSNSFKGNDLMVLVLTSETRISKWSKYTEQLHSSRWSNNADCLTLLRRFPVKLDILMCSAALVKSDGMFYHTF